MVDSSVWVAYLGPRVSEVDPKIEALLRPHNEAVITGVILQEILQGIKDNRSYELTQKLLRWLPLVSPRMETHLRAAEIFRRLVIKGRIPSTIDVLIAALAIENRISLFTLDKDFHWIAAESPLKLFR